MGEGGSMSSKEDGRRPLLHTWRSGYATVGLEMGISVALGVAGGMWLDRKVGTHHLFGLIGLLIGVVAAFRALWCVFLRARAEEEQSERERGSGPVEGCPPTGQNGAETPAPPPDEPEQRGPEDGGSRCS
jgi:ATP synthase protein I